MVKIMLKKPVGGQFNPQGGAARSIQYLEADGMVTEELKNMYNSALHANEVMSFVDPLGCPFLVAAENIAFIREYHSSELKN